MKKIYYALLALCAPVIASAHVKWFVDTAEVVEKSHGKTAFYSWGSTEVLVWAVIVFVTVFVFGLIDKHIKIPKGVMSFGLKHEKSINYVCQLLVGLFLVLISFFWKIILIPEIPVASPLTVFFVGLQVVIGCMFIFNIRPRIASAILILFCLSLFFVVGPVTFLENAILFSLAVYFFIVNSKESSFPFRFHKYGIEIVRIGTGISLITLAFTEKLLYPELATQFLAQHDWNFMYAMAPWFTNSLFILSTAFSEIIFGILFIMGYLTRTTTLLISVFFTVSVIVMAVGSQMWEVVHLVIYSAGILLLFYGHGRTKFFYF